MLVVSVRMKSSAVSVSNFSEPAGWDSAPTSPSGSPVSKKKGSAQAGVANVASHTPAVTVAATNRYFIHFSFRFSALTSLIRPVAWLTDACGYVPGYCSVLFEAPDGIRIEARVLGGFMCHGPYA